MKTRKQIEKWLQDNRCYDAFIANIRRDRGFGIDDIFEYFDQVKVDLEQFIENSFWWQIDGDNQEWSKINEMYQLWYNTPETVIDWEQRKWDLFLAQYIRVVGNNLKNGSFKAKTLPAIADTLMESTVEIINNLKNE